MAKLFFTLGLILLSSTLAVPTPLPSQRAAHESLAQTATPDPLSSAAQHAPRIPFQRHVNFINRAQDILDRADDDPTMQQWMNWKPPTRQANSGSQGQKRTRPASPPPNSHPTQRQRKFSEASLAALSDSVCSETSTAALNTPPPGESTYYPKLKPGMPNAAVDEYHSLFANLDIPDFDLMFDFDMICQP
ncbi:hypothetical protein IWQ60_010984 [Tieghemiomyces parasiticus]|uniref:Uncharacterized protein n=1 Tax=Tieghemiomyces parasiticus TaxID=78921 RepID=A0A9W8DM17_9FUNG|nr:hypothetical protein IWQ60_010984 [Tieghemiomyces parasiticus]